MNDTVEKPRSRGRKNATIAPETQSAIENAAAAVAQKIAVESEESAEERAQLAFEEERLSRSGMYEEDPALHAVAEKGSAPIEPIVDAYLEPGKDDISSRIAAARSGTVARPSMERTFEAPPPDAYARPFAPLPGERPDDIVGVTVVQGNRERVGSMEMSTDQDDLDQMIGSNRRRLAVSFDWARERRRNERHVFTRHYYNRGVLVDRFREIDQRAQIEASDKAAAITAYNLTVEDPREKIGYIALLAEALPTVDQVAQALKREIVIAFPVGEIPDASLTLGKEYEMPNPVAAPRGSARIGVKHIRGVDATYYHDVMKGIYTAHVLGKIVTAKSIPEADALVNAAITEARAGSAAVDETVQV